jgi:DNA replication protein DnaC
MLESFSKFAIKKYTRVSSMEGYLRAVNQTSEKRGYRFKRYHTRWFKPGSVGLIIGKKGTGKTTIMLDICYQLRDCPEVILFQKTLDTNEAFNDIVPGLFCYNTWQPDVVRKLIARQKKINRKRAKAGKPPRYITIILDDMAGDDSFSKDKVFNELIYNARWLKVNVIITTQFSLNMSHSIRGNIDWIFALREVMPKYRKRLYDHFFGLFPSEAEFNHYFNRLTNDRSCLVLNNTGLSTELEETYFVFRATPRNFNEDKSLPRWRMGSKAWWAFHYRHFNRHWDSSDDSSAVGSDEVYVEAAQPLRRVRK